MVPTSELIALQRSAAMLGVGQKQPVDGELLEAICAELVEARRLLDRFGADLKTIARRTH